jgi:hypothetical protein
MKIWFAAASGRTLKQPDAKISHLWVASAYPRAFSKEERGRKPYHISKIFQSICQELEWVRMQTFQLM